MNKNGIKDPRLIVYCVGIITFGLVYEEAKSALGGEWIFVGAACLYLLSLRLLGDFIARKWNERKLT